MRWHKKLSYFFKYSNRSMITILIPLAFMVVLPMVSVCQIIGIKAGFNYSKVYAKNNDVNFSSAVQFNPGFNLGTSLEFPIKNNFSLEAGLTISSKGFKYSEIFILGGGFKVRSNLYYVDIPLTVRRSYWIEKDLKISLIFGPYVGMGMYGTFNSEIWLNGNTERLTETVEWGEDAENDNYKRLDYGLIMGLGVFHNPIHIELTFGRGLANISNNSENGFVAYHGVLSISAAYKFNDTRKYEPKVPIRHYNDTRKYQPKVPIRHYNGEIRGNRIIY